MSSIFVMGWSSRMRERILRQPGRHVGFELVWAQGVEPSSAYAGEIYKTNMLRMEQCTGLLVLSSAGTIHSDLLTAQLALAWGKPVAIHRPAAEYPMRVLDLLPGGEAYDLAGTGHSLALGSGRQPPLLLCAERGHAEGRPWAEEDTLAEFARLLSAWLCRSVVSSLSVFDRLFAQTQMSKYKSPAMAGRAL